MIHFRRLATACKRIYDELLGPQPQLNHGPSGIDRRVMPALPFDGTPRQRHDDVGLLIQEYAGTPALFICRDGKTLATVQHIEYFDDYHPVKGRIRIDRGNGLVLEMACDWMLEGGHGLRAHNWDIVGLFDPEEPEIEA